MEAGSRQGDRFTQLRSRWLCEWKLDGKRPPRLLSLRSEMLEQVTGSCRGDGCMSTRRRSAEGGCPGR
ncbi:MAG: hypothetical protein Ct9H300mP1_23300 [Planctomycetaceae bacterium]|nr:MAG: hypothetical protein Ct9H300mP1_23300 [Planctomycetaceae bacterium]